MKPSPLSIGKQRPRLWMPGDALLPEECLAMPGFVVGPPQRRRSFPLIAPPLVRFSDASIRTVNRDGTGGFPMPNQAYGRWYDELGSGLYLLSPSDGQRPLYKTNLGPTGTKAGGLFDGADDVMISNAAITSTDTTYIAVVRINVAIDNAYRGLFGRTPTLSSIANLESLYKKQNFTYTTAERGGVNDQRFVSNFWPADNAYAVVAMRLISAPSSIVQLYRDGVLCSTIATSSGAAALTEVLLIGAVANFGYGALELCLFEIHGSKSDADLATRFQELREEFGTP